MTTVVPPRSLTGTSAGSARLGPVRRVPVVPVPDGATLAPVTPAGATGLSESVQVAFRSFGSGPDLLLVCGERCTMTSWGDAVLATLGRSFHVVVFDLPGTGYSGPARGAVTVESTADVVAGLVEALGLSDTTLLGWGIGGEVALATAERHPGALSHLVLLEATAGGPGAVAPAPAVSAELASPAVTAEQLASLYFPSAAGRARLAWLTQLSAQAPDDLVAAAVRASAELARAARSDRTVTADLGRVRVPVLVLSGSNDEVVPPANSARLATALHVREVVLAGAGYASMAQDETDVIADLRAFVEPPAAPTGAATGAT